MPDVSRASQDLLWSLWSELGVPGGGRRHQSAVIDPELLIAWTPHLARRDPRLLGLAFDWCAAHAGHISKVRFPKIVKTLPESVAESFSQFAGALEVEGIQWSPRQSGMSLTRERTKMALPLDRSALVAFRMRALCGTTARSDILTLLLASPKTERRTSALTPVGFGRRSIELALNDLTAAGFLMESGGPKSRRFRLREPKALSTFAQWSGLRWMQWDRVFELVFRSSCLSDAAGESVGLRRVEVARQWEALVRIARALEFPEPPGPVEREDIFAVCLEWAAEMLTRV